MDTCYRSEAISYPKSSKYGSENQLPPPNMMKDFILNLKEPTVVHNAVKDWTLFKWDLKDWSNAMSKSKIPFRFGRRKCTSSPQWESTSRTELLTVDEFIERAEKDSEDDEWMYFDYKYMNQWFKDHSGILQSVSWKAFGFPEFCGEDSTMWLGSKGAHTPCHSDSYSFNIVAQLYGKKMWIMFPPNQTNQLKPTRVPYEESSVYSNINFYCGNSDYSGLDEAYFTVLEPGDVLIVPNQWWHYVENASTAISINTWVPLDNDDEKRVEESLVKNFVLSSIKGLTIAEQKLILNPNEDTLISTSDPVDIEQLKFCINICKNKSNSSKEMILGNSNNENSAINIDNYGSIQTVNKKPMEEIIKILRNKCNCNKKPLSQDEYEISNLTVVDYINAFCHPDIVSKVKEKLLNKS